MQVISNNLYIWNLRNSEGRHPKQQALSNAYFRIFLQYLTHLLHIIYIKLNNSLKIPLLGPVFPGDVILIYLYIFIN